MEWVQLSGFILAAYVLGSIPSGYVIGRRLAGIDVRTVGSKNIGATNVARTFGFRWGFFVLLLDSAKGALPVFLALLILSGQGEKTLAKVSLVGLAAFSGHVFSLFLRFRGGKGVATAFGISLVLIPKAALAALSLFLIVTLVWRYVSLGSLTAITTLPVWTAATGYHPVYLLLSSIFALCVVIRHRVNIRALLRGEERKI
jgi:glycerol-3-phosphate acyltransferase PlsY